MTINNGMNADIAITEELRAIIYVPVTTRTGFLRRVSSRWDKGLLSINGVRGYRALPLGLQRMKALIVDHNSDHPIFKHRYTLNEDSLKGIQLRNMYVTGCQLSLHTRRSGVLAIHHSCPDPDIPSALDRLRLLGRENIRRFLRSIDLQIADHQETLGLMIQQTANDALIEPAFNKESNFIQLSSRTFEDHFVPFHMQTIELGLLLATQVELIRKTERALQENMWPWKRISRLRKLVWSWCIQQPPSNKYGRAIYSDFWEKLSLEARMNNSLDALNQKTTSVTNKYLFALTVIASIATVGSFLYPLFNK